MACGLTRVGVAMMLRVHAPAEQDNDLRGRTRVGLRQTVSRFFLSGTRAGEFMFCQEAAFGLRKSSHFMARVRFGKWERAEKFQYYILVHGAAVQVEYTPK